MSGLLIGGTDTGVGKTVVACAAVRRLRAQGVDAVGFKPVETGLAAGGRSDGERLAAASGRDEPLARPLLRLAEPLAPAIAAARAGTPDVPLAAVWARITALREGGAFPVVEGAGGLLAPLGRGWHAADLARAAGLPVLLVARAGLGTLNHVLLTVEALRAREIRLLAVVLCGRVRPGDLAEQTNEEALRELLPGLPIGSVPRLAGPEIEREAAAYLSVSWLR